MAWNGMFKKFNRRTVTDTDVVAQRSINAGGDVTGIRNDADRRLEDENEAVHAENRRLTEDVEKLRERLGEEYDRGYLDGLKRAWNLVDNLEGRPGKRQIADMLQAEIAKAEGGDLV